MVSAAKPVVCIVTPGTRSANNGNWRTAARWAQMLAGRFRVIVQSEWDGKRGDAMIALHARRSAGSIARFAQSRGSARLAVVLTGTDLYEDLPGSAEAARSLDDAGTIVVLQQDALVRLDERWRGKARVIFQSAKGLRARRKAADRLDCVAVGHLRAEKDPLTVIAAMRLVPRGLPIRLRHIGAPLDPALAQAARAFAREDYRYTYAGALPHGLARAAMRSAHFLVHASVVEGGANVIAEAVTGGTAVIASRISGNLGMLGRSYPGFFEARDASGLARCLVQALEDPRYRSSLERACKARKALFAPAAEQSALRDLARDLLA